VLLVTGFFLFYGEAVLLATAFFTLVLCAVGLEITNIDIKSNRQWSTLLFASRSVLVATDRSSWMPTASAVRYYTVMQPCFGCCGSLLSCQATWSACY